jgi:uncharacterized protein GlcG (DUF336 family)
MFKNICFVALTFLAALSVSPATGQSSAPVERPAASPFPSLAAALASAQAALAACSAYRVTVAVVDSAGELKVLLASDGAPPLTAELAWRKARTASTFKKASSQTKLDPTLQFSLSSSLYSYYGGGLPLKDGSGTLIGAIAISGGASEAGDEGCARAGSQKFVTFLMK